MISRCADNPDDRCEALIPFRHWTGRVAPPLSASLQLADGVAIRADWTGDRAVPYQPDMILNDLINSVSRRIPTPVASVNAHPVIGRPTAQRGFKLPNEISRLS